MSILRLYLVVLLGLMLVLPVAAQNLPLPLETMPNKAFSDVQAQAKTESTSGPAWGNAPDPSTLPVHVTLSGTVTADATMTKLAIFSDDGCDVLVDGTKVWSGKDTGQALPDLANSLHELPVTLTPGSHSVEIDYSNIIYTVADASKGIPPDIDGCTLFMYGPTTTPTVTVTISDLGDVYTGVPASSAATASVSPLPGGYSASQLVATWSYSTVYLVYSATGNDETWDAPSDGSTAGVTLNGAATSPDGTFSATLNTDGYYEACIQATVSFHNPTTGEDFGPYTGYGFGSNGMNANSAIMPHQMSSNSSQNGIPSTTGQRNIIAKTKPIDHIAYSTDGTNYKPAVGTLNVVKGQSIWFEAYKTATTPYASSSVKWRQGHTSADGTQTAVALDSGNAVNPIQVTFTTASSSPTDNSQDITAIVGSAYLVAPVIVSQFATKISLDGVDDAHKVMPGGIVVKNADNNNAPRLKVTVDVSNPPANWNGTITLTASSGSIQVFDASTGGNVIAFDGIHNVFSEASLPVTLYIQGQSAGSMMGDVQLKAQVDANGGSDTANITVLWCDQPTVKLTTADHVSPDDLAKAGYLNIFTGSDQLGGPFEEQRGLFTSCGAEGRATVHPANFDNTSFDLKLDQDTQVRYYVNSAPDPTGKLGNPISFSPTLNGVKGNDTAPSGPDNLRDDDQMKIGAVYQIDDPALHTIEEEPQGTIYRLRFAAKNFANITIHGSVVRCSPITEYSINLSNIQTQASSGASWTTLIASDPNAVPGDNMASVVPAGQQPPQTWNLK